jgi:hypothetical protein
LLPADQGEFDRESMLAVRAVFDKLEAADREAARTVWLRTVEGLTLEEVSALQNRKIWRVRADYEFGLRWMSNQLKRRARS